jgi:hypothetical protein
LSKFDKLEAVFIEEFGGNISVSQSGIVPEKDPAKERRIVLDEGTELFYLGSENLLKISESELSLCNYIVIWSKKTIAAAVRQSGSGKWILQLHHPDDVNTLLCDENDLVSKINASIADNSGENYDIDTTLSVSLLVETVKVIATMVLLVNWFVLFVVSSLFYTAIFALINRIFSNGFSNLITTGEYWKIGIYAGFPAMMVAAAFPVFKLPLFSYTTVYMIGMAGYWIFAANSVAIEIIKRKTNSSAAEKEDSNE